LALNRCPSLPLDNFPVYAQYFFSGTKPSSAPYRQLRAYLRRCAIVPRRHTSLSYFQQTTFHFPDNDVGHTVTESLWNHTTSDHKEGEQLEDRRNTGESSCNFGDGTDRRDQSLMFVMMMMMMMTVTFAWVLSICDNVRNVCLASRYPRV
jgi:hypothetical protein